MRFHIALPAIALATTLATTTAAAQAADSTSGPRRGTWGAEVSLVNSGALLRFRSARTAWVLGVSGSARRTEIDADLSPFASDAVSDGFSYLTLGLRRYGGTGAFRPLAGAGVIASYSFQAAGADSRNIGAGAYAEYGAAWFFNPHVSLGALGSVDAGWNRQRIKGDGSVQTYTTISATARAVRVVGSVYF